MDNFIGEANTRHAAYGYRPVWNTTVSGRVRGPVRSDRSDLDRTSPDIDGVAIDLHLAWKPSVDAVVAQQVRIGFHWPEIVDGHHVDVTTPGFDDRTQDVDSPHSLDTVGCGMLRRYADDHV